MYGTCTPCLQASTHTHKHTHTFRTYPSRDSPWAIDSDLLESRNSHFLPVSGEICRLIWIQSFLGVAPGYCLRRSKAESQGTTVKHFWRLHTKRLDVHMHWQMQFLKLNSDPFCCIPPSSRQAKHHSGLDLCLKKCENAHLYWTSFCVCLSCLGISELVYVCLYAC